MLKITIIDTEGQRKLVLEGDVVEPWATELRRAWDDAWQSLSGRKLIVDLTGVTVISQGAKHILHDMKSQGAEFVYCGVYLRHVLRTLETPCKTAIRRTFK